MAPYFLIFFLAASFTVLAPPDAPRSGGGLVAFILFAIFLALMIGFRWQVGGDWGWDIVRMLELGDGDITDYITNASDPGYGVLMWLGAKSGFNIWLVHLLGGGLFVYGLSRFCLNQIHPWLSMTVAIPYLVIVVAMGYDRQAVAIGFVMLAMIAMQNRSMLRFSGAITLAAAMHMTALSLMPVFAFGSRINKFSMTVIGGPIFAVGYIYFLQQRTETSIQGYIDAGYSSSGAGIRIAMNALPACFYFTFRNRFKLNDDERRFADVLALIALVFVGLLFASPSSTAVDRMALYIIPIQLLVLGRLPFALARSEADYKILAAGVVAYSAAVMFVWLNFADDAHLWVPYSLIDANQLVGLPF
jgi:hypothetical protein